MPCTTLYFDTACTRFHTDRNTGEAPRLLRLAWAVDDGEPTCFLILPEESTIDPGAQRHHGITIEHAGKLGQPLREVLDRFSADAESVTRAVSYNADFHHRQLERVAVPSAMISSSAVVCLMKAAMPICAIEAMRSGGGWKFPSLVEAHERIIGDRPVWPSDPVEAGNAIVAAIRSIDQAIGQRAAA